MTQGSVVALVTAVALAASAIFPVAAAETVTSAYTVFDSAKCRHEAGEAEEDYGSWDCKGYGGLRVLLSAGDQRMMVTFGNWKKDDIALSQTLPGFSDVYKGTVEWRIATEVGGRSRPFATILRWNVMKGADMMDGPSQATGRVLVVTRLGPGGVCHVGYVDARLNPNANELARRIADESARSFRCGKDKRIVLGATDPDLSLPTDAE